jgi:hypothetical protein
MTCNQYTCPDFTPSGRGPAQSGTGVQLTKEMYPKRDTSALTVPSWDRDCVMYYYEDLCESPTSLFSGGGLTTTTTTNPQTGQTSSSTTAANQDQFDSVATTGSNAGKLYKSLQGQGIWWESFCPVYTRPGGAYNPNINATPFKYRYWDHYPSELSFEPGYSDSVFLYLWDTKEHLTGLPCHAICWTLVIIPGESSGSPYSTYQYTPIKTPYYCDQTPDESYVEYTTEDGKLTDPDEKDENPLIHSVGTKDNAILFRLLGETTPNFADVKMRLVGDIKKTDFGGLGPWQKMLTRDNGTTGRFLYTEIGSFDGPAERLLDSSSTTNVYNVSAQIKNSGNQVVATVNLTITPTNGKDDTNRPDARVRVNSITKGSVLPESGKNYDINVQRQNKPPGDLVYIGQIKFTNIFDPDSGLVLGNEYFFFSRPSGESNTDSKNYRRAVQDVPVVCGLGSTVWGSSYSGVNSVEEIFRFEGSSAISGGTTGSGLAIKIRLEKLSDEDGASDTRLTLLYVINAGDGKYVEGQVFPIRFTRNGTTYTAGYLRLGAPEQVSAGASRGVPSGFRISETKIKGGVYAVSRPSGWTTWGNQYAVWCNDTQNNLSGRPLEIIHSSISLTSGTYTIEFGVDDSGSVKVYNTSTGVLIHNTNTHTGGLTTGSTKYTSTFTITQNQSVDIFVDVANNPGGSWEANPAGWAITLTKNSQIVWSTRDAQTGINVGDVYRGKSLNDTPYKSAWDGAEGITYLSPQGDAVWKVRDAIVYQDYSFPGGLKLRMKIQSIWNADTESYNTAWRIHKILSFGSGYGSTDTSRYDEDQSLWGDQEVFYLYYPSEDAPKSERIGISLMIAETTDRQVVVDLQNTSLEPGDTVHGWTIDRISTLDDEFNVRYAKISQGSNDFVKDTMYTTSGGQQIKVIAGFGIKDRAALFGKYEFTKKEIQYGTAFTSEGVPFEPDLIKPQVMGIVNNGRIVGAQILKKGYGLSNRNIEQVRLVVDPPPTEFNHTLYNQLILQGADVVDAIKRCTGSGRRAEVQPVISNGRLINVIVKDGGSGYSVENPPKISVPYIVRKKKIIAQEASTTVKSEPDNQILLSKSPAFKNFNLNQYNSDQQINYDEVVISETIPDIIDMELSRQKIRYEYPENFMDPKWSDQFNTTNRKEYKFTQDVQIQYDEEQKNAKTDAATLLRKTATTNNVGQLNVSTDINSVLTEDQRKLANTSVSVNLDTTSVPTNLPVGTSSDILTKISDLDRLERTASAKASTSQLGKDGYLDHYSTQFREFLATPVERNLPQDDDTSNNITFDNSANIIAQTDILANSVISRESPQEVANKSRTSLNRGFDQNILNQINSEYRTAIDKIPYPKTPQERKFDLDATTIRTVKGGFYKLPCSTNKIKYLIQNFCPDPREFTWINVRLGVRINPNPTNPDIGKCTKCLLDNPTYAARLTQIQSKDPGANIADAFCDVYYPLSSIFGSFLGYTPYTKSYLWGRTIYGANDDVIVENIRSWEISGNLQILHDLTQETKTFVDAVNKYGNPYDYFCNRNYGDLGEDIKFNESNVSIDEDNEVPDQLSDTSITNV